MLADADAVIFVVDSDPARLEQALPTFDSLLPLLEREPGPPAGLVLQANKRDLPGAVPLQKLRELFLEHPRLVLVESTASHGLGIRESFVAAVRQALDRVREQMRNQELPISQTRPQAGKELLEQLKLVPLVSDSAEQQSATFDNSRSLSSILPRRACGCNK